MAVRAFKPRTKGGKNFGIEMRGKTGLGLNPKDYTVYRKRNGDVVVVDKGYRRTKDEMKSWTKVGKDTVLGSTVRKMMVHDIDGETYRFTKASKTIAETEFLKPATQKLYGLYVRGWIDIRTGTFVAREGVQKFRNEGAKGDLQYEFASADISKAMILYEGYGLEEWYNQLSGVEKALINQCFSGFDWKNFWQVYFNSSPPEKNKKVEEKKELEGVRLLIEMTEDYIPAESPRSYRNFVASGLGPEAVERFF